MKITIVTPQVGQVATGNRGTAAQWAEIFRRLGHEVSVEGLDTFHDGSCDVLVVLNSEVGVELVASFREEHPEKKIVVALTGTDIYPEPGAAAVSAMEMADRLVVLQEKAMSQVPAGSREKVHVIVQSAVRSTNRFLEKGTDPFDVCVAGHLRDVKDPMRTAEAARLLPETSRIRVLHCGAILDEKYRELVDREQRENPRYAHLGEVGADELRELMARAQLVVVSSLSEGGARVIGESVVEGTPVLGTDVDGVTGLLGDEYPGFFAPKDTAKLAELLERTESDPEFRDRLRRHVDRLRERFAPESEEQAWQALLDNLL